MFVALNNFGVDNINKGLAIALETAKKAAPIDKVVCTADP
jgi:hypothetical protein